VDDSIEEKKITGEDFRVATVRDVFPIIELYQKAKNSTGQDTLFLDYKKLGDAINSNESLWIIYQSAEGRIEAALSMLLDRQHYVAKITRMLVNPESEAPKQLMRELLQFSLSTLEKTVGSIDVVYTTTLSMSLGQQEITLELGFKILGVFPNAIGEDQSKLNGLSAYYFNGALHEKRYKTFSVHPAIWRFLTLASSKCGFSVDGITTATNTGDRLRHQSLPELEMIDAPKFVEYKFNQLKERRSQVLNFYPFYAPNVLFTDPQQEIEVFVKISKSIRFAAIIGEYLEKDVDPIELYDEVLRQLRDSHVAYVEIINDAADIYGTECILKSGFTPCAYIPAFKRQNDRRRDFVVFGRSFEYHLKKPDLNVNRGYLDFYQEYYQLEQRNYLHSSIGL